MEITDDHGVDYERIRARAKAIVGDPLSQNWDAYNLALACLDYEKRIAALKAQMMALDDECKNWHTQYLRLLSGEQR